MTPDERPDGPERRDMIRRNTDGWIINHALSEHAWMKRVATAALLCVLILAVLDGFAVWRLQSATNQNHKLAGTAQALGVANRHILAEIQADRRRRIQDSIKTSLDICHSVRRTNDALISFLRTNQRLSRHLHVPGITAAQHAQTRLQERRLIRTLTITCTAQGQPQKTG